MFDFCTIEENMLLATTIKANWLYNKLEEGYCIKTSEYPAKIQELLTLVKSEIYEIQNKDR